MENGSERSRSDHGARPKDRYLDAVRRSNEEKDQEIARLRQELVDKDNLFRSGPSNSTQHQIHPQPSSEHVGSVMFSHQNEKSPGSEAVPPAPGLERPNQGNSFDPFASNAPKEELLRQQTLGPMDLPSAQGPPTMFGLYVASMSAQVGSVGQTDGS